MQVDLNDAALANLAQLPLELGYPTSPGEQPINSAKRRLLTGSPARINVAKTARSNSLVVRLQKGKPAGKRK